MKKNHPLAPTLPVLLVLVPTMSLLGCGGGQSNPKNAVTLYAKPIQIYPNPGDPLLSTVQINTGQRVTFAGTKNSQGVPTSIDSAMVDGASGNSDQGSQMSFDAQKRPLIIALAGGGYISLDYVATDLTNINIFTAGGKQGTISFDPTTQSVLTSRQALAAAVRSSMDRKPPKKPTTVRSTSDISVTCQGSAYSPPFVFGTFTPTGSTVALPLRMTPTGATGQYNYSIPNHSFTSTPEYEQFTSWLDENIGDLANAINQAGITPDVVNTVATAALVFGPEASLVVKVTLGALLLIANAGDVIDKVKTVAEIGTDIQALDIFQSGTIQVSVETPTGLVSLGQKKASFSSDPTFSLDLNSTQCAGSGYIGVWVGSTTNACCTLTGTFSVSPDFSAQWNWVSDFGVPGQYFGSIGTDGTLALTGEDQPSTGARRWQEAGTLQLSADQSTFSGSTEETSLDGQGTNGTGSWSYDRSSQQAIQKGRPNHPRSVFSGVHSPGSPN